MAISLKNINEYTGSDIADVWWSNWIGNFMSGKLKTMVNGDDSAMGRLSGAANAAITVPDLPDVNLGGTGGVGGAVKGRVTAIPTSVLTADVLDQIFQAAISNAITVAEGPDDIQVDSLVGKILDPMLIVINSPGASREAGTFGQRGYNVTELLYGFIQDKDAEAIGRGVEGSYAANVSWQHIDRLPYGEQILEAKFGYCQAWRIPTYWSEFPVTYHAYQGDDTDASIVFDVTPASEDGEAVQVWNDTTKLAYSTDYQVVAATKTLTFETAKGPAATERTVCKIKYLPTVC